MEHVALEGIKILEWIKLLVRMNIQFYVLIAHAFHTLTIWTISG